MVKVYFYDGRYKKVTVCTFLKWLKKCNLVIDEKRNIYYDGEYIGYYVNLSNNNFGVLDCILCLVLLALLILVLMKGGVIL
nr:MAG TPA: hypothetical protein [Caudoviricetes sp.]